MNLERYPVKSKRNKRYFEFYSKGPKGKIRKVIRFQHIHLNQYNLLFGDWNKKTKKIDSVVRSNNRDRDKVLATVASTVRQFMTCYPDSVVFARSNMPARSRLYRMALSKHLQEISYFYSIEGCRGFMWEKFQPNRNYDVFALKYISKN